MQILQRMMEFTGKQSTFGGPAVIIVDGDFKWEKYPAVMQTMIICRRCLKSVSSSLHCTILIHAFCRLTKRVRSSVLLGTKPPVLLLSSGHRRRLILLQVRVYDRLELLHRECRIFTCCIGCFDWFQAGNSESSTSVYNFSFLLV